jgi:signal transduction histidine kinase/HAMP domain-containing protein
VKLSVKYAITLVTLILCVVLSFSGILIFQFRSEIDALNSRTAIALGESVMKEIEEKEILTTQILAEALTNPLYQLEMHKIADLINAVRKQPNIRYVYVYDDQRRVIHDGTRELQLFSSILDDEMTVESMRLAKTTTVFNKDSLHVASPIHLHDAVLGGVRIGFSLNKLLADIARQQQDLDLNYHNAMAKQLYNIGLIAVIFSVSGIIASVALARSWSKPIIFLSRMTSRISKGDYDITIPFERSDEIGNLAKGFREMVQSLGSLRQTEVSQADALRRANGQLQLANDFLKNEIAEREWAQEQVLRQHRRISSLHEISAATNSTLDLKLLLAALFDKVKMILPYAASSVYWHDEQRGGLVPLAEHNLSENLWSGEAQDSASSQALQLSETLVEQNRPVVVENIHLDSRSALFEPLRQHGCTAFVGLPLSVEGKVMGALAFYLCDAHEFPNEEVEFLATLASQVAIAIFNSQLYERSVRQAAELEKAIHAKDEFLNVMSHELRTPLSVISGYAQALSIGVAGEISPEQGELTDKIIVQSNELLRMINEILQVGSLQAGSVKAYVENTNLAELFDDLQTTFDALAKPPVVLKWDLPHAMAPVRTDGDKLKHILQNLIHNAMKFTEQGSVAIAARCSPDCLQIEVKDTGIGIEPEKLPVIFDMFRQVDSSHTRSHGGVGVGLYIVKKYVELLRGTIAVESSPGHGTTFTLTIPTDAVAEPCSAPRQEPLRRLSA